MLVAALAKALERLLGGTAERVQHHGEEDDDASAREIVRERVGRGVSGDGRGGVRGIERGDGAEATRRGRRGTG